MTPIGSLPEMHINIPSEAQPLVPQRNGVLRRFSLMPVSEKGLLVALGALSICSTVAAVGVFLQPDPPPDPPPMDFFVTSGTVAKNCQQWTLLTFSLVEGFITGLVAKHFLQEKPQNENDMTPKIIDLIKKKVAQAAPDPERSSS